jgi:hypothetical protein
MLPSHPALPIARSKCAYQRLAIVYVIGYVTHPRTAMMIASPENHRPRNNGDAAGGRSETYLPPQPQGLWGVAGLVAVFGEFTPAITFRPWSVVPYPA